MSSKFNCHLAAYCLNNFLSKSWMLVRHVPPGAVWHNATFECVSYSMNSWSHNSHCSILKVTSSPARTTTAHTPRCSHLRLPFRFLSQPSQTIKCSLLRVTFPSILCSHTVLSVAQPHHRHLSLTTLLLVCRYCMVFVRVFGERRSHEHRKQNLSMGSRS